MTCESCGEEAPTTAKWCEACGHDLGTQPAAECVSCGEREVGEDGYCMSCGHKQPEERDHMEFSDGPVFAVTDRGRRHRHNEDAVAIGHTSHGAAVLVVCDGVSSTPRSAEASLRAAVAARDLLVDELQDPGEGATDRTELLGRAVEMAQSEASATADISVEDVAADGSVNADGSVYADGSGGPPSSTFVAVIAEPEADGVELSTAWVGDSRAYWVGEQPKRLSPHDHEISGSLVRWLGADSLDPTPDIELATVSGSGHLVVCSDGLWRYAEETAELNELVQRLVGEGRAGLNLASSMVDFANEGGGHDNISVALWSHH